MKTYAELYPGTDPNCPAILAPIEAGVRPLCDALNALPDTYTLWSCEGHPEEASTPFVTFIAPQETAFKLAKAIECSPFLKFNWALNTCLFREDGALQYTIKPNDRRLIRSGLTWWPRKQWSHAEMCIELSNLAQLITHRFDDGLSELISLTTGQNMTAKIKKDEAKNLAKRAVLYAFSYGLIRLKKSTMVNDNYLFGLLATPLIMMIVISKIFSENIWPQIAFCIYLIGGAFILLNIFKAKDPEETMSFLGIKNNWIIVLSIAAFISLTFGGIFYSQHTLGQDIDEMIAIADSADSGAASVDSEKFGFPPASEMAKFFPDSLLLIRYEQCVKNPKVLMRLVKHELSDERTIRDYSKTVTAWPIPLGYMVYNGDYPSGTYTYAFAFGKTFEDQSYKLKDLIVFMPADESKQKDRVLQHLTLVDSLCRDL